MDTLAAICERVSGWSSRLRKVRIVADYLRGLADDDLARAVHFLCGTPVFEAPANAILFGKDDPKTLSIGYATLREAYMAVTGWDADTLRICHREVGDAGETIGLLLHGHTQSLPLSLERASALYLALYRSRKTAEKIEILKSAFSTYRPLAIKYFVKVITGNLRIGLQVKMMEEAVAAAMGVPHNEVRDANNRLGDLARVALAARHGELHTIEARLFHPMDFMLAKPLDSLADLAEPLEWIIEDKYDGIRSQAHLADGRLLIYSRGMDDVTGSFPEIAEGMKQVTGSAVLDGELLAWKDGRALAFTVLQQRLARKRISDELLSGIPVAFMAYDILFRDGELLLARPIEERRRILELTMAGCGPPLLISPQFTARTAEDVDRLFADARERGNEGLVLKHRGSVYEPGRRSGAWQKLKRPYGTLDVVITAAEQGHGRRATVLSDYTFAVRSDDRFLNVGKAYSGLTDPEIRELTRILRAAATERFGRVYLVKPEIVLEVAFDGVQKSPRHKSGYALRFPRILRWRKDKQAGDADELQRVVEMYESSLAAGRST